MTIFQVEPITIAIGDTIAVQFGFVNDDGTIPDFSEYFCYYVISPYGFEDTNIFSKEMSLVSETQNEFAVTLDTEDTSNFEAGAYTAKIVLSDGSNYFKKARGNFNVIKDTSSVEVG